MHESYEMHIATKSRPGVIIIELAEQERLLLQKLRTSYGDLFSFSCQFFESSVLCIRYKYEPLTGCQIVSKPFFNEQGLVLQW